MRLRIMVIGVALILAALPAFAAEPDSKEKRFLKTLANGLASESEDVRAGAAQGLIAMKGKAAYYLVREIGRLKPDARAAAIDVLIALANYTRIELKGLSRMPSGAAGEALQKVKDALVGEGGSAGFGDRDPEMDMAVDKIMRTLPQDSWSSRHPGTDELAELGREAIPSLLAYLDPAHGHEMGSHAQWAQSALAKLCNARDVPRLGALLDDRWDQVANTLEKINSPTAVPYLVRSLERRHLTNDIGEALKHFADPRSRKPAVAFVEGLESMPEGMMPLCDMLVKLRAREAVPALRKLSELDIPDEFEGMGANVPSNKARNAMILGRALAELGEPKGVEMLFPVLEASGFDDWLVRWAGEALNKVTGQSFWYDGCAGSTSRAKYEAWWHEKGSELKWNESRRRFMDE